jgi:hypothetical protein
LPVGVSPVRMRFLVVWFIGGDDSGQAGET